MILELTNYDLLDNFIIDDFNSIQQSSQWSWHALQQQQQLLLAELLLKGHSAISGRSDFHYCSISDLTAINCRVSKHR